MVALTPNRLRLGPWSMTAKEPSTLGDLTRVTQRKYGEPMKKNDIVSAWRDEDAFLNLSEQDRAQMPEHPAGIRTLRDDELKGLVGAAEGTHYSFCDPTASWCDDCGPGDILIPSR